MVMFPGPFLKREMVTSVRCGRVIPDRLIALLLVAWVVAGCVGVWDEWGWDRTSVRAAAWFALVAFGLTAFAQAGIAIGLVVGQVAPAIASERDRKSLYAVLTTQLSGAEIVVGTMAAGLLRAANGLAAVLPLVVLMVFLGGVDPGLVLLSGAGLASTALAAAAISIVASVGAPTRGRAVSFAVGLVLAWFALPPAFLTLRMLLWKGGPRWLTEAALWLLDSSPFGVGLSLMPAWNPLLRVPVDKLSMLAGGPAAGQARLEFNIALRQCSAFWAGGYVLGLYSAAALGVKRERERGTWLGLIATPLCAWEIVRAKMLGPVLSSLRGALTLIALWTVGLMAGAVPPPGLPGSGHGAGGACLVLFGTGPFHVATGGRHEKGRPPTGPCRPPRGRGRGDHVGGGDLECPRLVVAALVRGCFLRGSLGRVRAVRRDAHPEGGGIPR
jgi:hypothetical protein